MRKMAYAMMITALAEKGFSYLRYEPTNAGGARGFRRAKFRKDRSKRHFELKKIRERKLNRVRKQSRRRNR